MEIREEMSIGEKKTLFQGYLKRLNKIDLIDSTGPIKPNASKDLFQLAMDISGVAFPVFTDFGTNVYASFSLTAKAYNFRTSYYEIGRDTISNNPRLFFTYLQTKIARTLRDLDPKVDLETS